MLLAGVQADGENGNTLRLSATSTTSDNRIVPEQMFSHQTKAGVKQWLFCNPGR